jgi:transposase
MKSISDPKKMACHAGVAPFNYQSGSSVRGRPGVSQHARKRLKSLFHLGAMASIRAKGELQDYYASGRPATQSQGGKKQDACP